MKNFLLIAVLTAFSAGAQVNHMVNWHFGVSTSQTFITVEQGDTVTWTLTDAMPHTVTSNGGVETFDSGLISGVGNTYSHTFETLGVTPYVCSFHASMEGQVTVTPSMGIENVKNTAFRIYPNPAKDVLNISSPALIDRVTIIDMSGKIVFDAAGKSSEVRLYVENYPSGSYIVKVQSGGKNQTETIIKN